MTFVLTLTSQGQVTIPSKARKMWGNAVSNKLLATFDDGKMVIRPARSFSSIRGIVKVNKKVDLVKAREDFLADLGSR